MAENGQRKQLTPKREKAVQALLTHGTVGQAANAAGIGERTLRRWLDEEESPRLQ